MREMKDSGLKWIGKIPSSWNVMPNKYLMKKKKVICPAYKGEDILSLTMKGVIVRDLDAGGKMPTSFDGYQRLEPGNLLMCLFDIDVTPRCIGLIKQAGLSSPAYSQFALNDMGNAEYYCYYYTMLDNDKTLLHLAKNLRHSLTEDQLGAISAIVPPVQEQKKIADFLDAKCAKIDALTADIQTQIDTLEQYKRSVITEAVIKGLNPDAEMKDSGEYIGGIPQNWEISRVKHVAKLITDGAHITPDTSSSEEKFISVTDMDDYGNLDFDHCLLITGEQFKTFVKTGCSPQKNDVLISKDGTIGKTTVVRTDEKFVIASSLVIIRPDMKKINPYYLKYCLMSEFVQEQLRSLLAGSALKRVSVGKNANLKFVYTDNMVEQQEIVSILDKKCIEINSCIEDKKKQLDVLAEYKKSLIYEYVTGKKEVPAIC